MIKQFQIYAIGRKKTESSEIEIIEFPDLNIVIDVATLTPESQRILSHLGFVKFLESPSITQRILAELDILDEDDEVIQPLSESEIRKKFPIGAHDRLEAAHIEFLSSRRSSYCERFLPPIMKTALLVEFILFIPLLAAAIGNSEMDIFNADAGTAKKLGTAQGLLFTLYVFVSNFAAPGANNMSNFGVIFDDAFHSIWRILTCKNNQSRQSEEKEKTPGDMKRWMAKGGIALFSSTYLISDFLLNYQQFKSMEAQVSAMAPFSVFPEDVIRYAMKINFYLNQINDPIFASSFVSWSFAEINKLFPKKQLQQPAVHEVIIVDDPEVGSVNSHYHAIVSQDIRLPIEEYKSGNSQALGP